ncbi:MAG: murein biosynthesis integral membrane protein MurJ, partial [Halobacteriovoraceae bacterium]|nr:murein biosynthesis integral membrane protein MurJ [Halobacteriovoraceae bacterium]
MTDSKNAANKNAVSLLLSSLKMAFATFSSRILGLVREQVMASAFGASGVTDAFTIAYRIPNMLRDLFAEGAFSSAFVPILTNVLGEGEEKSKSRLWTMAIILFSITGLISIGVIIFAKQVVFLVTDDLFVSDPQRLELTVQMVRIMAPFLTLISLAALFMGALNTLKVFFVPSLAPAFFNVVMILFMIFLPPVLEEKGFHPALALALGVIAGGFVQMLIQVPLLFKKSFGPNSAWEFRSPWIGSILNRLGIGTVGIAATQINILITTILATGTQVGAVSWLTYAFRLFQFPVGILSVSIAGSNLVHFSSSLKSGDQEDSIKILGTSYQASWLVIIPAFCLLMALATPTVHLIFERGAFGRTDTLESALALKCYLVGLPFYGLYKIFAPTFFSLDRPKIPVFISITAIVVNIIFCTVMVPHYGFAVLALGTSLSMMLNCGLQAIFLKKYLDLPVGFYFPLRLLKFL